MGTYRVHAPIMAKATTSLTSSAERPIALEEVDEVAADPSRRTTHARVADEIDATDVGAVVRAGESGLSLDELREVRDRLVRVH